MGAPSTTIDRMRAREHSARLLGLAELLSRAVQRPPAATSTESAALAEEGIAALTDDWLDELAARLLQPPPGNH